MANSLDRMNVVLMLADQLRADSVGCYGNPIVRTPHIDQLAKEGTRFASAFAQHPQCVPSRTAILTGRYVHSNGALSNFVAMSDREVTIGEWLQTAGYQSIGVGKLHIFKQKEKACFTNTMLSEGQQSDALTPDVLHEDYKKWVKEHGYWNDLVRAYARHGDQDYRDNFQAIVSPMPAEAYIDSWVGDRAAELIRAQSPDQPFFMFIGFPNPHNPFDPPEPYASMYDPDQMPLPPTFHSDLSRKPPHQMAYKRGGRKRIGTNYEKLDAARMRRVIAHYYGTISLVDDQVGKVMKALAGRDLLNKTVVIFMSDHGEFLGHHGLLLKPTDGYPMLYDQSLMVPLILRVPSIPGGRLVQDPVELIDLFPTIAGCIEIDAPPQVQGQSLLSAMNNGQAPQRDFIFAEIGAVKMLRGRRYKLIYYPTQRYGELYDLLHDPLELDNLYDSPSHQAVGATMIQSLLDRLIYTEAPLHGESLKGHAYWRKLYRLPFVPEQTS